MNISMLHAAVINLAGNSFLVSDVWEFCFGTSEKYILCIVINIVCVSIRNNTSCNISHIGRVSIFPPNHIIRSSNIVQVVKTSAIKTDITHDRSEITSQTCFFNDVQSDGFVSIILSSNINHHILNSPKRRSHFSGKMRINIRRPGIQIGVNAPRNRQTIHSIKSLNPIVFRLCHNHLHAKNGIIS